MSNDKSDTRQWFLRIAGGAVFGPVATKGLIVWAEQGRIVPGNEVSNDRETWISAEAVPELEMKWYVNAGSKTEGPFNRVAAESFLRSGKAPEGARLVDAKDVDPAAVVDPKLPEEAEAEDANPAPEAAPAKPAAPARPAAPRAAPVEPDAAADASKDRRIAELEAALEKQREASAQARQAAKAQAALEDERDELRKQNQDLQAQMESFRANAEKDTQKRERKLDALKQEVARLQQAQEEAAGRAALLQPAVDPELKQACDALRKELAESQSDNQALRRRAGDLDQRVADLASQVGQLETERRKLAEERERLQQQLGVAMSEAADAVNATASAEMRRRIEQLEAVVEGLRNQLAQSEQTLAAERTSQAELLAASNERDLASRQRIEELEARLGESEKQSKELGTSSDRETRLNADLAAARTRIAELQARLARAPEGAAAERSRPAEAESWLRQYATDELTALDKALHEERRSFNGLRELSASRQEAIQARIQSVQRLLSGTADARARATTPGQRIAGIDQSRLQSEVVSMREAQVKEAKQFEEREAELMRRIRVLETEDARLRSLLEATDMESGKKFELMETIRRREQELAQERRTREQDREQFDSARQALQRRIEELERAAGIATESPSEAGDTQAAPAAKPRTLSTLGSWLKR
jgi:chromosome segregation ATPase